jgi:prepilin-type N-terminal cleavage/methylation domain-containing protein
MRKVSNIRRQHGFTLIELVIVLVIIGVLMMVGARMVGMHRTNANIGVAKAFFMADMPAALAIFVNRRGSLTGVTKTDLTGYGITGQTPWKEDWTMSGPVGGIITITYPLSTAADAAVVAGDLAANLTNSGLKHISSATVTGTTLTVAMRGE